MPLGPLPAAKVPSTVPLVDSFVTLLLPKFATQMLVPSKAIPPGWFPTAKVPRVVPLYSGLSLAVPERVRFRYSLDGSHRAWSDPTPTREPPSPTLTPGSYPHRLSS